MKTVTFVIQKDGKVITDFNGFTGESCITESNKILSEMAKSGIQANQESIDDKPERKERVYNELKG